MNVTKPNNNSIKKNMATMPTRSQIPASKLLSSGIFITYSFFALTIGSAISSCHAAYCKHKETNKTSYYNS